jgi:UDP-GlcNAc:undecaprenyl-phosphate GlcNAc-1-phosphate transferase
MTPYAVIPAIFISLIVAISFMLALRPLAMKVGLVDKPDARKRHEGNVPVIGGIAILPACLPAYYSLSRVPVFT